MIADDDYDTLPTSAEFREFLEDLFRDDAAALSDWYCAHINGPKQAFYLLRMCGQVLYEMSTIRPGPNQMAVVESPAEARMGWGELSATRIVAAELNGDRDGADALIMTVLDGGHEAMQEVLPDLLGMLRATIVHRWNLDHPGEQTA